MVVRRTLACIALICLVAVAGSARAEEMKPCATPGCAAAIDRYFAEEVWAKIGAQSCLTCHKAGGDAEDSKFILQDPQRSQGDAREQALRHNQGAFMQMARLKEGDEHRILLKVT